MAIRICKSLQEQPLNLLRVKYKKGPSGLDRPDLTKPDCDWVDNPKIPVISSLRTKMRYYFHMPSYWCLLILSSLTYILSPQGNEYIVLQTSTQHELVFDFSSHFRRIGLQSHL
jgi:hypothetical protein